MKILQEHTSENDRWGVRCLRRELLGGGAVVASSGRCVRLIRHLGTRAEVPGICAAQLTSHIHRVVLQINAKPNCTPSSIRNPTILPLNPLGTASTSIIV